MKESQIRIQEIMNKLNLPLKDGNIIKSRTVQEQVKLLRKLKEEDDRVNKETPYDQKEMEDWFNDVFRDLDVIIKFDDLKVYNDLVFWSGVVNGIIQFVFKVSENPDVNGVELNYTDDIDIQNPKNNEIIERLEQFYKDFSKYWIENQFQST